MRSDCARAIGEGDGVDAKEDNVKGVGEGRSLGDERCDGEW